MKIVFVDFDGMLNTFPHNGNGLKLEKVPVINLEYLLKKVKGLKIVVSSAWRSHGLEFCREALKEHGIDPRKVVGITGEELLGTKMHRGNQIECWLARHPSVKDFVILDDSRDMEPFLDKLVRTSPMVGLTQDDVEKAISILGE